MWLAASTRYVLLLGFGALSSNLVASGFFISLISPTRTVLFLEGSIGDRPREVTIQTGASYPGFNLFKESMLELTNGLTTS